MSKFLSLSVCVQLLRLHLGKFPSSVTRVQQRNKQNQNNSFWNENHSGVGEIFVWKRLLHGNGNVTDDDNEQKRRARWFLHVIVSRDEAVECNKNEHPSSCDWKILLEMQGFCKLLQRNLIRRKLIFKSHAVVKFAWS